jgi:hypothetical protein
MTISRGKGTGSIGLTIVPSSTAAVIVLLLLLLLILWVLMVFLP